MLRRKFIQQTILGAGAVAVAPSVMAAAKPGKFEDLVILHTNDMHSHIEPFPENDPKYPGRGGISRRAALIDSIRNENKNVLVFDCGDIFQGTPYFNYYLGELEIKLMNEMKYDAATIGNHDFDGGLNNLGEKISQAQFPFINCNYKVENTILEGKVEPYKIYKRAGLKIGVTGVGVELSGLVDARLYGDVVYQNPLIQANQMAGFLKNEKKCDLVICLSHLGYSYNSDKVSDQILAKKSENIDIILGGHTHTFLDKADVIINESGQRVLVSQAGWAGLMLGRIDVSTNPVLEEVSINSSLKEIF